MSVSLLIGKKIAVFGLNAEIKALIDYLAENNIHVVVLDEKNLAQSFKNKNLVEFKLRDTLDWSDIECLIVNRNDLCLIEEANKKDICVFSIIDFLERYFPEYNYIGVIGESGSSISVEILKHVLSSLNNSMCKMEGSFTIDSFSGSKDYIFEVNQKMLNLMQKPYFNNVILLDLNFDKRSINTIREIILNQNEDNVAVLNIDEKAIKIFYDSIKEDKNYKSNIVPISINKILKNGVSFINSEIYVNFLDKNSEYITEEFKNLSGDQNRTSVLAVLTLMMMNGRNPQEVLENIYNFKSFDEVFEVVSHQDNFIFINDIRNKNKEQSLKVFDNIYWVLCLEDIQFEFHKFNRLIDYFGKIKYVFILGKYDEDLLKIFKDNHIEYFILYNMNGVFEKIRARMEREKKEEKITVLLSSINNIEHSVFYSKCGVEFEKLANLGE